MKLGGDRETAMAVFFMRTFLARKRHREPDLLAAQLIRNGRWPFDEYFSETFGYAFLMVKYNFPSLNEVFLPDYG